MNQEAVAKSQGSKPLIMRQPLDYIPYYMDL
jgi:hypothetical protein